MDTKPAATKPGRSALRTATLKELQTADTIGQAAQREPFATQLAGVEITAAFVATLRADIATCHQTLDGAFDADQDHKGRTTSEGEKHKTLVAFLRRIQAAASQKYARDPESKHKLAQYGIGTDLLKSRSILAQHAPGILSHLAEESLPGLDEAFLTQARQALTDWTDAESAQAQAQQTATLKRTEAQTQIKTITDRRIQIQYAIEGLYPHPEPSSAAARAAFLLPKSRPFRG
jgi:hypothetical protein